MIHLYSSIGKAACHEKKSNYIIYKRIAYFYAIRLRDITNYNYVSSLAMRLHNKRKIIIKKCTTEEHLVKHKQGQSTGTYLVNSWFLGGEFCLN